VDRIDSTQRDPARKFGHPDEIGATCVFLRSAHSGYLTGQNIAVDVGASRGLFDQRSRCRLLVPQPNNAMTLAMSAVRVDRRPALALTAAF